MSPPPPTFSSFTFFHQETKQHLEYCQSENKSLQAAHPAFTFHISMNQKPA